MCDGMQIILCGGLKRHPTENAYIKGCRLFLKRPQPGYLSVKVSKVEACSLGWLVPSSHFSSVRGEMCRKFAKRARLIFYFSLMARISSAVNSLHYS